MVIDVSKSPEHCNSHHLHDNRRFSLQPSGFFAVYDVISVIKVQGTIESIWQHSTMIYMMIMMIIMMKTYSYHSVSSVPSGFN